MSILSAFKELAEDEGRQHAVNELQRLQSSLETIVECGDRYERDAACLLLEAVNNTINELVPV